MTLFQEIFLAEKGNWFLYICFVLFASSALISIFFALLLLLPEDVAYLGPPSLFYTDSRREFENEIKEADPEKKQKTIDEMMKVKYLDELEGVAELNRRVFQKKSSLYVWAFRFALLAILPYLVCLSFHFSKNEDNIQKVQIVNLEINRKLQQTDTMVTEINNSNGQASSQTNGSGTTGITTTTETTRFPGVSDSLVRPATIHTVKEGSTKVQTKIRE